MSDSVAVEVDAINAALDRLERALTEIDAMPDRQQVLERAHVLANRLRTLADRASELRARAAHQIWTSKELSLAQLAEKINLSKTRVNQLVQGAKKAAEAADEQEDVRGTDDGAF